MTRTAVGGADDPWDDDALRREIATTFEGVGALISQMDIGKQLASTLAAQRIVTRAFPKFELPVLPVISTDWTKILSPVFDQPLAQLRHELALTTLPQLDFKIGPNLAALSAGLNLHDFTEGTLRDLAEMLASEEIDAEEVDLVSERVEADDPETSAVLEQAATILAFHYPWLTRAQARRVVVLIFYLGWAALLFGLSFVPVVSAVPGALGASAPAAADKGGKAFDRVFGDDDAPEESE